MLVVCCGGQAGVSTPALVGDQKGIMQLHSDAFAQEATIPRVYTCDGADRSPPLRLTGIPDAAQTLVVVMDDPDAPRGTWDHWVAYDAAVTDTIPEGVGSFGTAGTNSWGRTGYGGPCPPGGSHRYFFRVYALDTRLGLAEAATKAEVLGAMEGHVLDEAVLMGTYSR